MRTQAAASCAMAFATVLAVCCVCAVAVPDLTAAAAPERQPLPAAHANAVPHDAAMPEVPF